MSQSHMSQSLEIEKMNEIKGTGFDSSVFTGESAEPSLIISFLYQLFKISQLKGIIR